MRIIELSFDPSNNAVDNLGLTIHNGKLAKLGNVVALIGKNGSGKSRFLETISAKLENYKISNSDVIISYSNDLIHLRKYIDELIIQIDSIAEAMNNRNDPGSRLNIFINNNIKQGNFIDKIHSNQITSRLHLIQRYNSVFDKVSQMNYKLKNNMYNPNLQETQKLVIDSFNEYLEVVGHLIYPNFIYLSDKSSSVKSSKEITIQNILSLFLSTNTEQIFTLNSTVFQVIRDNLKKLITLILNRHAVLKIKKGLPGELSKVEDQQFEKLEKYLVRVNEFLQINVEVNVNIKNITDSEEGINGIMGFLFDKKISREVNVDEFSTGQKVMLTYITFLYLNEIISGIPLEEQIILIDEPENHLHPDVQVELLKRLRNIVSESGQLWIATHSPIIMAELEFNEIFYVEDSTIYSPGGENANKALRSLISREESLQKLSTVISGFYSWQFYKFTEECLIDPEVIREANEDDPQAKQFKKAMTNLRSSGQSAKLLDYGAGEGRLADVLLRNEIGNDFSYHPFDTNPEMILKIKNRFESDHRVKEGFTDILSLKDTEIEFDLIVLCNVLHEIEVRDWADVMNTIIEVSSENSYLLFMEDLCMRVGELPNTIGYLVLNGEELSTLLLGTDVSEYKLDVEDKNANRLFCASVQLRELKVKKLPMMKLPKR